MATTQINFRHFVNERKQTPGATCCMIPFMGHSEKGKTIRMENSSLIKGVGRRTTRAHCIKKLSG